MSDVADDDQPDPGAPADAPWADADETDETDDSDETLRTFVVALAGFVGALVVVSLIGLLTYGPRKKFIHRHPVLAEVLHMGRNPSF